MKTKSEIGKQIRAVRKYNEAIARAFRHWGRTYELFSNIVNLRAFKRHFRQACRIEARAKLTLIDFDNLPAENVLHVEPTY